MKTIVIVLLSSLSAFPLWLLSQSASPVKPPEFDHATVYVRDLQKSAAFYDQLFGLERIPEPFKDGRHVWYRIGPHQQLHVVSGATQMNPQGIDVHIAFRVASFADFVSRLDRMQVKHRDFKGGGEVNVRPDGVHQTYLQDPDGYWIEVNDDKF